MNAEDILNLRPNDLQKALTKRMASDTILAEQISKMVGYIPRWYKLSAIEYAQIALAWASLEEEFASTKLAMRKIIVNLNEIRGT